MGKYARSIVLICFIFLASCHINPFRVVQEEIPERDIVFQLDVHYAGGINDEIGFINADGSGVTYIKYSDIQASVEPIWTDSGDLLFSHPADLIEGISNTGYLISFRDFWASDKSLIHGMDQILVVSFEEDRFVFKKVDIQTRKVLDIYQINESSNLIEESIGLGSNNFHDNRILYSRLTTDNDEIVTEELRLLDLNTNESNILLHYRDTFENATWIIKPSFSPTGDWIAYTSKDGIYLIRPDGSENHRIINHTVKNYVEWPPGVSWSPDGEWIIYHKCFAENRIVCSRVVEENTIFKYNITTGEEIPILKGGLNPYWRWVD